MAGLPDMPLLATLVTDDWLTAIAVSVQAAAAVLLAAAAYKKLFVMPIYEYR